MTSQGDEVHERDGVPPAPASADASADAPDEPVEASDAVLEPPATPVVEPPPAAPAAPSRPVVAAAPAEPQESFGRWLRRQRVGREIDLREIADSSKISLRYLEALEDERFDVLPAPVFAKGFLRQYARYVGLDPEEVVNFFQAARRRQQEETPDVLAPLMGKPRRPPLATGWTYGILVVLVVALLVALVWWLSQLDRERRRTADAGGAPAAASRVAPEAAAPAAGPERADEPPAPPPAEELTGPLRVTLDFNGECWVEAWADGDRVMSELRVQGESQRLQADEDLVLKVGNVFVVGLEVNGHPYRPEPGPALRWLRFSRAQVSELERGAPISPLPVPTGEGSPRSAPSAGAAGALAAPPAVAPADPRADDGRVVAT